MTPRSFTRRKFLALAATAGVAAIAIDSALLEPNRPRVVRRDVPLRRWPEPLDGFKIAVLSDFHYDHRFSVHPIHAAVKMVNELNPDLIALAGDFVSIPIFDDDQRRAALAAEPCARLLHQMQAPHGSWAVMGNHDYYTNPAHVTAALQAEGIRVLANESVPIETNSVRFWLAGVNGRPGLATWRGCIAQLVEQLTLNQRVEGSSPSTPTNDFNALRRRRRNRARTCDHSPWGPSRLSRLGAPVCPRASYQRASFAGDGDVGPIQWVG